jgi:L-aminopeptidase/D-esterase-like protein
MGSWHVIRCIPERFASGQPEWAGIVLAFTTGNDGALGGDRAKADADCVRKPLLSLPLEAIENAGINAIDAAKGVAGRNGNTVHAADHAGLLR